MKTLVSVITIFMFSIISLNCNSDSKIDLLDKRIQSIDSLLRMSASPCENGITFNKTGNASNIFVKIRIVYSYRNRTEIPQEISFPNNVTGYFFQSYLTGCQPGTRDPAPKFYIIQDNAESNPVEVPVTGTPFPIDIEQPGEAPGVTRPLKIIINDAGSDPCNNSGENAPRAVYTVEMN